MWNTRAQTAEELAHNIAVLHRHCNTEGRDPAQIRKTAAGLFKGTFDDVDGYLSTAERYAVHVDLIIVGPLPSNPDPVGAVPPPWRRAHTQTGANRLKGTVMRILRATMIAVGIIQILTGAIFLVTPATYAELLHLQPAAPAWVNRLLAMCDARFVGYGIGMFVAARAPWRNRVWIDTMIAIQVVDFIAIAGYLADGVASLRQFPVVVLPLLWIALLGCDRTRAHAAVPVSSPPESATVDGGI